MLLRHTVPTLVFAATLSHQGIVAPRDAASPTPTPPVATEAGRGSAALTCLGCVAAGVITLASGGWGAVWTTFMVGGTAAVAGGSAIVTCTTACIAYIAER